MAIHNFEKTIIDCMSKNDNIAIIKLINLLHNSEVAQLMYNLTDEQLQYLFNTLPEDLLASIIPWFSTELISAYIDEKSYIMLAKAILNMSKDEIVDFMNLVPDEHRTPIMHYMSTSVCRMLESNLLYPKESAGRLMNRLFITVLKEWDISTVKKYIKNLYLRSQDDVPSVFYDIFIVDKKGLLLGVVNLQALLTASDSDIVWDVRNSNTKSITATIDQEEVALIFRQREVSSIAVVNDIGVLVGVISIDDVVDVIYREHEEDFLMIGGVGINDVSRVSYKHIFRLSFSRFKWLSVNFIGSILITMIISYFHNTLVKYVILAAMIQFVVSIGGNAGLQSLAITLRGLALKIISKTNYKRQIIQEIMISAVLSLILGGIAYTLAFVSSMFNTHIAIVVMCAMIVNTIVSIFFGTVYPIVFKTLKLDPAKVSSTFVTTSSDIFGFLSVLLIANIVLP